MESVEVILAMLVAVVASGYLVRALPFALPLPLLQITMGAVIAGAFHHGVAMEPRLFFFLFLPPLLFLDGWKIPNEGLRRDKVTILALACGLVVFTVLGAGLLVHALIPAVPLPVAFALAAIVSPTDAVAVSAIAARVAIPARLMNILAGESLLNDASGLVCFRFAVAAALTGDFSVGRASLTFLWVAIAGTAIGAATTLAITTAQQWLSRRFGEPSGSPTLASLLVPFGAYLLAEAAGASGMLAAVAAGITMSYVELSGRALASTRLQRAVVWDMLQLALNGTVFVLLGEQLPSIFRGGLRAVAEHGHPSPWLLAFDALVVNAALLVLRFAWVWASMRLTLLRARRDGTHHPAPSWRLVLATTLAGVRGAVTLAGVMTLPLLLPSGAPFPARALAIFLASSVILVSLVVASFALPPLLRGLLTPAESMGRVAEEGARHDAAFAAIGAIEAAEDTSDARDEKALYSEVAARLVMLYERRLVTRVGGGEPAREEHIERALRLTGLQAERTKIFALARQRKISDAVSRKLVREIDLLEARYR